MKGRLLGVVIGGFLLMTLGLTVKVLTLVSRSGDFAEALMAVGCLAGIWGCVSMLAYLALDEASK